MPHTNLTDFTLPADGYATFDAVSLKRLIIDRLNENSLFTDQNFEGSNLSSLIDIFATAYHTLLFYLNQSATESLFNEAQLYENMNRIVKVLDYKPVGPQSSILPFAVTASLSLSKNTYTIPRYSFINANGVFILLNRILHLVKQQGRKKFFQFYQITIYSIKENLKSIHNKLQLERILKL